MAKVVKIKTKETAQSVEDFLGSLPEKQRQKDCFTLLELLKKISKESPKLWSSGIIGYGNKIFESPKTGRKVEWFKIGFAPRKSNISIYLMSDFSKYSDLFNQLGKHKTGAGCLYFNKLEDINIDVLRKLMLKSLEDK